MNQQPPSTIIISYPEKSSPSRSKRKTEDEIATPATADLASSNVSKRTRKTSNENFGFRPNVTIIQTVKKPSTVMNHS